MFLSFLCPYSCQLDEKVDLTDLKNKTISFTIYNIISSEKTKLWKSEKISKTHELLSNEKRKWTDKIESIGSNKVK